LIISKQSTDAKSVIQFAERLRQQISQQQINIGEIHIQVTISIGVALKESGMKSEDHLVNAADKALYAAKNAGRNRVFLTFKTGSWQHHPSSQNLQSKLSP
jgi:two-component system cell cycle response regulator